MLKKHKYTLLWGLWTLMIIVFCLLPPSDLPDGPRIPNLDKIAHFTFYFGYTILFVLAFWKEKQWLPKLKICYLWAFFTALFLGEIMEVLQAALTTTRSADVMDTVFNNFGTVVALLLMTKYQRAFR